MGIRVWTWMWLLVVVLPLPAWGQLTAGMAASRTSGTAPLFVFFDGTADAGVSHSDPDVEEFRDLLCEWNFGDTTAGTWSNTGASRNLATGCIGAHVYESPGTYTATLRISDEAGTQRTVTQSINVLSPDITWSGANTVCFENGGGFAGCPSGATRISTNDYDAAISNQCGIGGRNAQKRCLFRRGDEFNVGSSVQLWNGPILIGAFGSGPRPIVRSTSNSDFALHVFGRHSPAQGAADIRFQGIEYIGGTGYQGNAHAIGLCGSSSSAGIDDILFLDLTVRDFGTVLACADSGNPQKTPDKIGFVNNTILSPDHRSLAFISTTRTAFLNNTSTEGGAASSHIRVSFGRKIVIQHNQLTGTTGNTSVKMAGYRARAAGGEVPDIEQQRYWVISDNRIDCNGGNCMGGYNAASDGSTSILDQAVIERNDFRIAQGSSNRVSDSCFAVAAWRNNVFRAGSDSANPFLTMSDAGGGCVYDRGKLRIYNNTFYGTGSRPRHAIRFTNQNPDSIFRNNLYYSPGDSGSSRMIDGSGWPGVVISDNLQTNQDVFANVGAFDAASDFELDPNASQSGLVIDAGFDVRSTVNDGEVVFVDFREKCLTNNAVSTRRDLGAFESGAVDCDVLASGAGAPAIAAPNFLP